MIFRNTTMLLLLSIYATLAAEVQPGFPIDAPGPGYDQMKERLNEQTEQARPYHTQPSLRLDRENIFSATTTSFAKDTSQIQIKIQPKTAELVGKEIEYYKGYPLRLELGDYTLPIDFSKTLPWTGVIWLEPRLDSKNSTILATLTAER